MINIIQYTVTTPLSNGQLENIYSPGVAITTFTQPDLVNNKIKYIHDGSNTITDEFIFKLSDNNNNELTNQTFNIEINKVAVTDITLDSHDEQLDIGETTTIDYTLTPSDPYDDSVTWSSDNNTVASVNATSGLITAMM